MAPFKTAAVLFSSLLVAACGGGASPSAHEPILAAQQPQVASVSSTAVLVGNRADYAITLTSGGYVAQDLGGHIPAQTFANAAALQFADMSVNLGIAAKARTLAAADLKSLIELYI